MNLFCAKRKFLTHRQITYSFHCLLSSFSSTGSGSSSSPQGKDIPYPHVVIPFSSDHHCWSSGHLTQTQLPLWALTASHPELVWIFKSSASCSPAFCIHLHHQSCCLHSHYLRPPLTWHPPGSWGIKAHSEYCCQNQHLSWAHHHVVQLSQSPDPCGTKQNLHPCLLPMTNHHPQSQLTLTISAWWCKPLLFYSLRNLFLPPLLTLQDNTESLQTFALLFSSNIPSDASLCYKNTDIN